MLTRVRTLTPVAATLLALGTAIGTVAVAGPAAANPGGVPAIPLNTEQETTGSDTGASGFFSYTIQGSQLCYTLEVRGLSLPAVAAHIHKAPRHVAGPIVIPFSAVPSATTFETSACVTPAAALLADLQANPKSYYVNVHTANFPGGEVRGQLK
ncbi:MAG TPA: CHRD domain-containing protein [Lapillicoccus sp.]